MLHVYVTDRGFGGNKQVLAGRKRTRTLSTRASLEDLGKNGGKKRSKINSTQTQINLHVQLADDRRRRVKQIISLSRSIDIDIMTKKKKSKSTAAAAAAPYRLQVAAVIPDDEKKAAAVPADDAPILLLAVVVVVARHGGRSEDGEEGRRRRRRRSWEVARLGRSSVANVGWDIACLLFFPRSIPQTKGIRRCWGRKNWTSTTTTTCTTS